MIVAYFEAVLWCSVEGINVMTIINVASFRSGFEPANPPKLLKGKFLWLSQVAACASHINVVFLCSCCSVFEVR